MALPKLLSIPEFADQSGLTIRQIRSLIFQRKIPYIKLNRLVRFREADLLRWLDENSTDSVS